MNDSERTYRAMRDIWHDYNHRQEFEHTLLDRKTTWLLATQAILFTAYGITFSKSAAAEFPTEIDEFRTVVAYLGMWIAGSVLIGLVFLVRSKRVSWREYRDFFAHTDTPMLLAFRARPIPPDPPDLPSLLGNKQLKWGAGDKITYLTLAPDFLLPLGFIVAWCFLRIGG
jgi:hypothetical protein